MAKLIIKQNTVDYYGFFAEPLFSLYGEARGIVGGLYKTFAAYSIGLGNFRIEPDPTEPANTSITVLLPRFGNYRLKFESVQVGLRSFSDEDFEGFVGVIQKGDAWLRETTPSFTFKSHASVYSGHFALADLTSSEFLLSFQRRNTPVVGKDLGSGILETWFDPEMDAKIRLTIDHSLQEPDGIYINYMVTFDRDTIDYVKVAQRANSLLESVIRDLGLEFE
jgi:hypothetical protein